MRPPTIKSTRKKEKKKINEKIRERIMKILDGGNTKTTKELAEILEITLYKAGQHCGILKKLGKLNSFEKSLKEKSHYAKVPFWFIVGQYEHKNEFKKIDFTGKIKPVSHDINYDDGWIDQIKNTLPDRNKIKELALRTGI